MSNKKINKAVENLQKQIDKGNDNNVHYDTWKTQCQSLIQEYFSSDSKEYLWFERPVFADAHYGINSAEYYRQETIKAIKNTQEHLKSAIDTVKIKGIYQPAKGNYLSRLSDTWIIYILGLMLSGYVGVFYIGRWTVEKEKKSTTVTVPVAPPIIQDEPNKQAKETYDTTNHEKK